MKRTPLKSGKMALKRTRLKRSGPRRARNLSIQRKRPDVDARCPACKIGLLIVPIDPFVLVEVCPGHAYRLAAVGRAVCDNCGHEVMSRALRRRLESKAYTKHWQRILERDGWRCVKCGATDGLEVHHIVFRSQRPGPAVHDPSNLQTLCVRCHELAHGGHPCD